MANSTPTLEHYHSNDTEANTTGHDFKLVRDTDSVEVTLDPRNVKVDPVEMTADIRRGILKTRLYDSSTVPLSTCPPVLRKQSSEPILRGRRSDGENGSDVSVQIFDNPAFEVDETQTLKMNFSDAVKQVLYKPSLTEDYHPYGRGSIYETVFGQKRRTDQDDGTMFLWIIVATVILGLACAVILMSVTYEINMSKASIQPASANVTGS